MTYTEAIQFLYNLRLFGAKFGLENTRKLAALAGNPHHRLRFIHVAGTNGKGSTCAMLESVYRAAGLKVGLFTSPHLVAFGERIQVDRALITEEDVVRLLSQIRVFLDQTDIHATFFEVVTIMALVYFAEQQCDLVVWETGLGGRLDATNIVTPLASVITNIQFDHQQWLGDTLAQIAFEKAGIIKPGIPVITATDVPEALTVISQVAGNRHAPLSLVKHSDTKRPPLPAIQLSLRGEHQELNAALALATIQAVDRHIHVTEAAVRDGLEQVDWPGRLQVEITASGQTVLMDGAHNPAGAGALRAAFIAYFPQVRPTLILGILRDKDWQTMCQILAPLARCILAVPVHSDRTAEPEALQAVCHAVNPGVEVIVCHTLADALSRSANDPFILLAGSLYLVGEAMELLQWSPDKILNERGLNEWSMAASSAQR